MSFRVSRPHRLAPAIVITALSLAFAATAFGADEPAKPKIGKLPHLTFDINAKQVRVEAEALEVDAPLEFFCVLTNTAEHESILRSPAKPSDIHTALLAIGLKPGRPVSYSETLRKWSPPQGPPLQITVEWEANGKKQAIPAYRLMRDVKTKKAMPPLTWVWVGSRQMEDGTYAADTTGYIISVVNFDLTLIDIPQLASNANEALEWERNPDLSPPHGTKVTMVIEPAGNRAVAPGGGGDPVAAGAAPVPGQASPEAVAAGAAPLPPAAAKQDDGLSDVQIDEKRMAELRDHWLKTIRPHAAELRAAAQAHYEVMTALRREQQRLIDEADRIQRTIDQLEKEYQDFTTPTPAGLEPARPADPAAPARSGDDAGPFGRQ